MKKLFLGLEPVFETPDYIMVNKDTHWWRSRNATAFMILSDKNDNSALIYNLEDFEEPTHRKMLESVFNILMFTKLNLAQLIESNKLGEYFLVAVKNPNSELPEMTWNDIGELIHEYAHNKYDDSLVFGRAWKLKEGNFVSTWEDPERAAQYRDLLINFLKKIGINPATSQWELRGPKFKMDEFRIGEDYTDFKFVSIDEFFSSGIKQKPEIRAPHEIAGMKKALGQEAPGFGSYKQGEIAASAKMPFAQYHAMVQQESNNEL